MPDLPQYYSGSYPVSLFAHLATSPIGPPWNIQDFSECNFLGYARQPMPRESMTEDPSGYVVLVVSVTWTNNTEETQNPAAFWIDGLAPGGNNFLAGCSLPQNGFGPIPPGQTTWNVVLKGWLVPNGF